MSFCIGGLHSSDRLECDLDTKKWWMEIKFANKIKNMGYGLVSVPTRFHTKYHCLDHQQQPILPSSWSLRPEFWSTEEYQSNHVDSSNLVVHRDIARHSNSTRTIRDCGRISCVLIPIERKKKWCFRWEEKIKKGIYVCVFTFCPSSITSLAILSPAWWSWTTCARFCWFARICWSISLFSASICWVWALAKFWLRSWEICALGEMLVDIDTREREREMRHILELEIPQHQRIRINKLFHLYTTYWEDMECGIEVLNRLFNSRFDFISLP